MAKKRFQSVFFEIWQLLENWEPEGQERVEVKLTGPTGRNITIEKDLQSWKESQAGPNLTSIRQHS